MADDTQTATPAPNAAAAAPTPAPKAPPTVIEGMDSRRMFDSTEDAANYLNNASTAYSDFGSVPQVIRGVITEGDDAGNFDPAIYTDDMRVMVAVLANRGEKGKPSTSKAIVVTPAPKLDALLASESGKLWVAKIIDKELNHVAVRALRTADDLDSVADQMPLTLTDYISSNRESSGIMDTFNTLFKGLIAAVAEKSTAWAKARLTKNELKKAMESRAYALAFYPKLEDRGDKPSFFTMAMGLGINTAKAKGLDPAIFEKWMAERNEKPLNVKQDDDESEDFDLDDLAFAEDTPAADATVPAETTTPATPTPDATA